MTENAEVKVTKLTKDQAVAELLDRVDKLEVKIARQEAALKAIADDIACGRINAACQLVLGKQPKT